MTRARMPVALPLIALALLVVMLLQGCASAPQPAPDADQADRPRTQQASFAEPACGAVAAFGLISAVGLPLYMVVSGFANRACSGVAK